VFTIRSGWRAISAVRARFTVSMFKSSDAKAALAPDVKASIIDTKERAGAHAHQLFA